MFEDLTFKMEKNTLCDKLSPDYFVCICMLPFQHLQSNAHICSMQHASRHSHIEPIVGPKDTFQLYVFKFSFTSGWP